MFEPFITLEAVAVPMDDEGVDTGRIFPSRFLRKPRSDGFQNYLFRDARFDEQGRERPDFIMNRPPFRGARIMVAGAGFGGGSSREAAVHALFDAGFRCIIAPSFGDIFAANCIRNGLLPVVLAADQAQELRRQLHDEPGSRIRVDLERQIVQGPNGRVYTFEIAPSKKMRLLRGLDDCAAAMEALDAINAFEERYVSALPWLRS